MIIRSAKIYTMSDISPVYADILVQNGKIVQVAENISADDEIFDAPAALLCRVLLIVPAGWGL